MIWCSKLFEHPNKKVTNLLFQYFSILSVVSVNTPFSYTLYFGKSG